MFGTGEGSSVAPVRINTSPSRWVVSIVTIEAGVKHVTGYVLPYDLGSAAKSGLWSEQEEDGREGEDVQEEEMVMRHGEEEEKLEEEEDSVLLLYRRS
ncbi:uncharacterized [Tachysurus ichikawai]